MAIVYKFVNGFVTRLVANLTAEDILASIPLEDAQRLPGLGTDERIKLTLWSSSNVFEIIDVQANPGTGVLTVLRGQEGSLAQSWPVGTQVLHAVTADILAQAFSLNVTIPQAVLDQYLLKSGGALTGFLSLHTNPTNDLHAATKQYVDALTQGFLPLAGGAMSGNLNMAGRQITNLPTPSAGGDAANKDYVNTIAGLVFDQTLIAFAAISFADNDMLIATGPDQFAKIQVSDYTQSLLPLGSAVNWRATLGLGDMAIQSAATFMPRTGGAFTGPISAAGSVASPAFSFLGDVGANSYFALAGEDQVALVLGGVTTVLWDASRRMLIGTTGVPAAVAQNPNDLTVGNAGGGAVGARNCAKAWARYATNGAGVVTSVNGFNVSSIVNAGGGNFNFTFSVNVQGDYCVVATGVIGGTTPLDLLTPGKAVNGFTHQWKDSSGVVQTNGITADIVVFGG